LSSDIRRVDLYQKENKPYVYPSHNSMRIIPIPVVRIWIDICVSEHVKLCKASTTGRIDGEQYGPGEQAADKGDYDGHLEVSKQEKGVE